MDRTRSTTPLLRLAIALALPALAIALLIPVREQLESGEIALFFVLVVWAVAALAGVWPGLIAAVASFLALVYFFMPPYQHLSAASRSDWLTLTVFMVVAGVAGLQTGRLREREDRAVRGEREAEVLAALTAQLVSQSSAGVVSDMVASEIVRATGSSRVVVLVPGEAGDLARLSAASGPETLSDAGIERFSRWVLDTGVAVGLPPRAEAGADGGGSSMSWPDSVPHEHVVPGAQRDDVFLPLTTPAGVEGVLYIAPLPHRRPLTDGETRLAVSFSRILGAFLERRRLEALAGQMESAREAERLKSTLVSSVSHELKTPLAAMTATVSGLLATDAEPDIEHVRRDLAVVDDGLRRLSASIADLLDLSRLESASWQAHREPYEVGEIVGALLGRMTAEGRSRIELQVPTGLPPIEVDFVQWSRALSNLIENGLDYSAPDGRVTIGARVAHERVETWVEDNGPGVPEEEREHIFEKFYRGKAAERVPSGTGLGLTITEEIVRFNGGTIELQSAWPSGARFVVSVPAAPAPVEVAE